MVQSLRLNVNGERREVRTETNRPLLEVLREDLGLTGTKYGCGEGQCRACTVLLDGKAITSCITPVSAAAGKNITTIEGLAKSQSLHPVQQAFASAGGMQCGYCTPGMILTAVALLERTRKPSEAEIVKAMNGNICRCGGYSNIVAAVRRASGVSNA